MLKNLFAGDLFYKITGIILSLFVFVPYKLKPYIVVILAIAFIASKPQFKTDGRKLLTILSVASVFILYLLSLIYTENIKSGLTLIGRQIPLILVPVVFAFMNTEKREILTAVFKKLYPVVLSVYVMVIFLYLNSLGCFSGDSSFEYGYSYLTHEFFGFRDHPIYISTYLVIGLLMLLSDSSGNKWMRILLFLIIFSGLLVLSRKGSIIAFVLCGVLFFIYGKRHFFKAFVLLAFVAVILFSFSNVKYRFEEVFLKNKLEDNPETSSGIRLIVWKTAYKLAFEQKNPIGHGAGSTQDILDENYKELGYNRLISTNYNAHNQYLQTAITVGKTGLLLFLLSLFWLLYQNHRQHNRRAILFLSFFIMIFLTESYLERQNGVIFFSIIISMFTFAGYEKKYFSNRSISSADIGR